VSPYIELGTENPMDALLDLIVKNRDWLFSGIGVVAVTFIWRVTWNKFHPGVPVIQSPMFPAAQTTEPKEVIPIPAPATNYSVVEMERAYIVRRVHVGDYIDIARGFDRNIRISVKGLDELETSVGGLSQTEREDVVALAVDLGGAIAYCGANAKRTGVNEFLIPQLQGDEALRSVFSFINTKDYTSMLRIGVEHINRPAGMVDLNIVHVVGLFR